MNRRSFFSQFVAAVAGVLASFGLRSLIAPERSPKELATLLLDAVGQEEYVIPKSSPPTTVYRWYKIEIVDGKRKAIKIDAPEFATEGSAVLTINSIGPVWSPPPAA
jgi:hypothetical protein